MPYLISLATIYEASYQKRLQKAMGEKKTSQGKCNLEIFLHF